MVLWGGKNSLTGGLGLVRPAKCRALTRAHPPLPLTRVTPCAALLVLQPPVRVHSVYLTHNVRKDVVHKSTSARIRQLDLYYY